jgi:hypothetical protein
VGVLAPGVLGCSAQPESRISVAPALRPVDPARPMVVFSQVRGEACGNDAVAGAIRNMKRLSHVDGYLEVVVEETGENEGRCARVTAYPFRYGTSTDLPGIVAGGEPTDPVLIPGATSSSNEAPAPGGFDCTSACGKFAALVATGIEQSVTKERCITRCGQPDTAFRGCITQANSADSAKACLTP